ncbi:MAG: hypothetical protein WCF18_22700, partial [Chthoniobacteraceae bacterium]
WLIHLPQPAAKVIRAIARQFERAGTDGLETTELWQSDDVKHTAGLAGLREGGDPAELIQRTKETLFVA